MEIAYEDGNLEGTRETRYLWPGRATDAVGRVRKASIEVNTLAKIEGTDGESEGRKEPRKIEG